MFVHESNLISKINKNYNGVGEKISEFFEESYKDIKKQLSSLSFSEDPNAFQIAVDAISDYLNSLDEFAQQLSISSQSKFRSTFLEEISVYLTREILNDDENLSVYTKNVYSGLKIIDDLKIDIIKKDVDFCIGKEVELVLDNNRKKIVVPIIAVEIKTYLDGTMINEVQYSAEKIKNATPSAKIFVLMEYNQVAKEKISEAGSNSAIDEMFVLRDSKDDKINPLALEEYYNEIRNTILSLKNEPHKANNGRLFNNNN